MAELSEPLVVNGLPADYDPQPYYFAFRHAQTGDLLHLHLDPHLTREEVRDRIQKRVGRRPSEMFDFVGVKKGSRVVLRGKRAENGSWEFEEVDVRRSDD